MDRYFMWIHYERLHNHNKAKHNKTVCIFLGIYCSICLSHCQTEKTQMAIVNHVILCFLVYVKKNGGRYCIWLSSLNIHYHLSSQISNSTFMAILCHLPFNVTTNVVRAISVWYLHRDQVQMSFSTPRRHCKLASKCKRLCQKQYWKQRFNFKLKWTFIKCVDTSSVKPIFVPIFFYKCRGGFAERTNFLIAVVRVVNHIISIYYNVCMYMYIYIYIYIYIWTIKRIH